MLRTRVDTAPEWTVQTLMDGERTVLLVEGGLRIELDPPIPLPADRGAWARTEVARALPTGGTLELIGQADDVTLGGAPMTLVTARVRVTGVVEVRHVGFYVFGEQGAVVMARLLTREASTRFTPLELDVLLRSARLESDAPPRLDDLLT